MEMRFCVDCKIPLIREPIQMTAIIEGDVKKAGEKRIYFTDDVEETPHRMVKQFTLDRSEKKCFEWTKFFIKNKTEIDDFVLPIEFSVKFAIADDRSRNFEREWLKQPAFEVKNPERGRKEIDIEMCKGKAVDCLSKIRLEHSLFLDRDPQKILPSNRIVDVLQGSSNNMTLLLKVSNTAEVAIMPNVTIRLNSTEIEVLKQDPRCTEPEMDSNQTEITISCQLDRLLTEESPNSVEIVFPPFNRTISMSISVGIQNRLKEGSKTSAEVLFQSKRESNIGIFV